MTSHLERKGTFATNFFRHQRALIRLLAALTMCTFTSTLLAGTKSTNPVSSTDASGTLSTYSTLGGIDQSNPFFQSLGTNGRTCGTCHTPNDAMTISPPDIQARFNSSNGTDPLFRTVDGANCPSADVSSFQAEKAAYSLLLNKGLIRISLPVPANAGFQITQIEDPYNCAQTTSSQPAMYRRPLPATNLNFLSAVMWDGRETVKNSSGTIDLNASLKQQATDATLGHAQAASAPTAQELSEIVSLETNLFTAQSQDENAGSLTANGAYGGPINLSKQPFYIGINDPFGSNFNQNAFTTYSNWASLNSQPNRQAVARGEMLFNTLQIKITGVVGLNDALGKPEIDGTCTTCHDTPNVGNHSVSVPLNIGTTAYPPVPALDVSGLPVYTIQCTATGATVVVTDPGRALISGSCADLGKVKGPILRGLAGRAPYFHNGGAATLNDVVEFYNERFNLNLTEQQKADLVAFLQTL